MIFLHLLARCPILAIAAVISCSSAMAGEVIRIMAANITTGTQDYDNGEGNRIFQGLDPDIALVQEMNYLGNTTINFRSWVDMNFDSTFSYFRESGAGIPNGIVSRYPIISAGEWVDDDTLSDRDFVWAKIDIPGDKDLWAISVHLKASSGAANATRRDNEAKQLLRLIAAANIPAADYLVIGGDFNTFDRTEACISTLSIANQNPTPPDMPGVFITTGPWPADQAGNENTNKGRAEPYDWVIPDADLNACSTPLVIGTRTFSNGLVYDSRVTSPYSFLPTPILSTDSADANMQHMAVMRAFLIPVNDPPAIAQGTGISRTISQNNHPTAFAASLTATDADGNPLAWNISAAAAHGSASIVVPPTGGSVALGYTPANDYLGSDSFTVRVSDGAGGTDTIAVNVTVNPVSAYDAWTFDRFAPLLPPGQATTWGESANPDFDAYTNLAEFAYGLNPAAADVAVNPMEISSNGGQPVLSFLVRMDGSGLALQYDLQTTADLASSVWAVVPAGAFTLVGETVVNPDFRRRMIQLNSIGGQPRTFYRLRIRR